MILRLAFQGGETMDVPYDPGDPVRLVMPLPLLSVTVMADADTRVALFWEKDSQQTSKSFRAGDRDGQKPDC